MEAATDSKPDPKASQPPAASTNQEDALNGSGSVHITNLVRSTSTDLKKPTLDARQGTDGTTGSETTASVNGSPKSIFPTETAAVPTDQVVSWAKTLHSPTLPLFSPSIDANKSEQGYHGKGLQISVERSRQLNRTTHRCLTVLQELTSLYSQYAVSLNKAGEMLPRPNATTTSAAQAAGLADHLPFAPLQKSMTSWAKGKSRVAQQMRSSISPLMQTYLSTHSDTITGIQQRYSQSRNTCAYARARAVSSHNKYTKTLRECEHLIQELKSKTTSGAVPDEAAVKEENASEPLTADTSKNTPNRGKRVEGRLKESLNELKFHENRYKIRVSWENDCVSQCQRLESMALESMQKIEEDRLTIFVNTIIKVMAAQKQALDAGVISLAGAAPKAQACDDEASSEEKNSARKFVKMLAANSFLAEEDTSGAMDAETLGLPDEVGKLRDKVRARLSARRERMNLSKTLSMFFESVVKASTKLGQSLLQLMKKEGQHHNEALHVAMGACEGAHVLRMWDGMTSFIEAEAQGCFAMADSLRNVRAAKLDTLILYGEKAMKTTSESDDLAWKQLCEASRVQTKAENKHKQSSIESARARERMLSLDSKSQPIQEEDKDKNAAGKRIQKGFGKVLSLLPDGGDKAMQILGPSARVSHAQRGLKEADEKEAKEKQQLDAAVEAYSAAYSTYKSEAELIVSRYDEEEKQGWQDIKSSIESFAELAQKLLGKLQLESISDVQPVAAQSQIGMTSDINDFRMKAQQELVAICVDSTVADDSADSGFRLEVRLQSSNMVEEYMESTGAVPVAVVEEAKDDASIEEGLEDDEDDGDDTNADTAEEGPITPSENKSGDDVNLKALFRRSALSSHLAVGNRRAIAKKLKTRERTGSDHADPETDLFLTYFWPDPSDAKSVPLVVDSWSCSFRDVAQPLPSQYGRVYVSSTRVIFTSWTKKKLNLRWEEVRNVRPAKSFEGHTDDALQIVCKRADAPEESCMVLDGLHERQAAIEVMEKLREEMRVANEALATPAPSNADSGEVVPPDAVLKNMKVVVSKHLRNISLQRFYEIVWSEKEKPLFRPWLEKEAFDIDMGDWTQSQSAGAWCKETYTEQRLIKFKIRRKTHLYIGPPIANVVQVHRCRVEGNDKCVVAMTIEFEGIPYSDSFAVEVRWVASREGKNNVKVECGLVVDFKKKTFLKSKIESGTLEESAPVHKDFFQTMQAACVAAGGVQAVEEPEEPEEEPKKEGDIFASIMQTFQENPNAIHIAAIAIGFLLMFIWRFFLVSGPTPPAAAGPVDLEVLLQRVDTLGSKLDRLQNSMDELLQRLEKR